MEPTRRFDVFVSYSHKNRSFGRSPPSVLWNATANRASVVIYGTRRTGKTSILRNLDRYLPDMIVVDFDMQRVGPVQSTGVFLLSLAYAVDGALPDAADTGRTEPFETEFLIATRIAPMSRSCGPRIDAAATRPC